jgi:ATP-binding cassette subfamily F protein 3
MFLVTCFWKERKYMLLEATNISKSFGENLLFADGCFKIEAGDKIGLIGSNGCGKTTLFSIISGAEVPDNGGIVKSGGATIGVLHQFTCADSKKTCYEEALSVFEDLIRFEEEMALMHNALENSSDATLIEKADVLREKFQSQGGLTFRARTRSALIGLGFTEAELSLSVDKLSGGQRSKIEICKLLLSSPDIMLLDEPTNHLDIDAIEWLDGFIKQSRSAVVIISHDRYFLDRVADKILSIEHKKLYMYPGNYTKYLELRRHREETIQREYNNTMREVKRIEGIIEQQRRWNREKNIKTAESKQKQIDRMLEGLEIPESEAENMTLRFTAGNICSENVLSVSSAHCEFDNKLLYRDVSFDVLRGDRIAVLGKNGCGKTTLIKSITDGLGQRGIGVKVGYFDQHSATLKDSNTIFGQLREDFPAKGDTELRCALALFLFKGDDVFKEISTLSGGEKARVALCCLMLKKDNFLILDEPTNHLDLASREILENALEEFEGTILAVSHDRWFINKIANRIFYFENKGLSEIHGNYDDYLAVKQSHQEAAETPKKAVGTGGAAYKQQKAEAARQRKLKTQLENTEKEIEALEARQAELEVALCDPESAFDYELMLRLSNELDEVKTKLISAMELWENLSLEAE